MFLVNSSKTTFFVHNISSLTYWYSCSDVLPQSYIINSNLLKKIYDFLWGGMPSASRKLCAQSAHYHDISFPRRRMTRKQKSVTVQCKALGYYESSSRHLKMKVKKFFSARNAERSPLRASKHCLRQWPDHSKIARAGAVGLRARVRVSERACV